MESLGIHPSETVDVMEDREVWQLKLELLPPALTEKRKIKKEEVYLTQCCTLIITIKPIYDFTNSKILV